ncbi:substrate-binding periplasmic protein [Thalassotalea ganghwensis]
MVCIETLNAHLKKIVLISTIFCYLVFNVSVSANQNLPIKLDSKPLKYAPSGSGAWIPYYIPNQDQPGIIPEITNLILHKAQIEAESVILPPKRTNFSLEKGLIDFDFLNPQWLPDGIDQSGFVFSMPILPIKEYFVSLKTSDKETFELSKDNPKLRIGTVSGYYYHDEALFERDDFPSEKAIVQALASGRIEHAILGDLPALYWAEKLGVSLEFDQLHSDGFLHIRLRSEHKDLLPQFNNAIIELKQNSAFQRIIERYVH